MSALSSSRAVVEIEQVHRIYRTGDIEVRALRGVSLTVAAGEMVAVMGPSGSGKSTLMNIIGCLDRPSRGTYRLEGRDVSTLSRDELAAVRNAKIGFIFQSLNLVARTSAIENVSLPLVYAGVSADEQRRRASEALAAVGLAEKERSLPNQLSGGQQQRVAIARALVNNPAIIIADEPTGALDTRSSLEIMEILERMNHERGLTILMVTHEHDIAQHAQRLITIRDGRINQDSPVAGRQHARDLLGALPAEDEALDALAST